MKQDVKNVASRAYHKIRDELRALDRPEAECKAAAREEHRRIYREHGENAATPSLD